MATDIEALARSLTNRRIEGLRAFPRSGQYIRATVYMPWAVFNWLRLNGLAEGDTQRARLTPLGSAMRDYLKENRT